MTKKAIQINQYDFHDGTLYSIENIDSNLILTLESSCIHPEYISDNSILSIVGTLRGKLHIDGVSTILEDNKPISILSNKGYEVGNIFDFDLKECSLKIVLGWERA